MQYLLFLSSTWLQCLHTQRTKLQLHSYCTTHIVSFIFKLNFYTQGIAHLTETYFLCFQMSWIKKNLREKKILLEQMKSKNNLVCALLPLDRGIMQRVWQEVFHPPLCCVWSPLQQHLSGDNLEKMLPLPFDMLLCWDLEDANHPELFSFLQAAPLKITLFFCLKWKMAGRHADSDLQSIVPFTKDAAMCRLNKCKTEKDRTKSKYVIIFGYF